MGSIGKFPEFFLSLDNSGDGTFRYCAIDKRLSAGSDGRVRAITAWLNLKSKCDRDFEPVRLFCDQLCKVNSQFTNL